MINLLKKNILWGNVPTAQHKNCFLNVYLVLGASHLAAAFGAFATGLDAIFHASHLLATLGAGVADISTNAAKILIKSGTAQHAIAGGLTDFGTVNH